MANCEMEQVSEIGMSLAYREKIIGEMHKPCGTRIAGEKSELLKPGMETKQRRLVKKLKMID
jgi:hypothetical protein